MRQLKVSSFRLPGLVSPNLLRHLSHVLQESLPPGALGELAPDRDMTFEEKRKLSAHIASVPGEKLSSVLDIIEECEVRVARCAFCMSVPVRACFLVCLRCGVAA
jgi:hypothetical protein